MTLIPTQTRRQLSHRLTKVGTAGASYFKVLLDLLSGRRNLFF